jgi:hypothetical protein
MEGIRVFLIGVSLFADTVAQLLRGCEMVGQVERFDSIPQALCSIDRRPPDLLILADVDTTLLVGDTPFLPICPDIPVICTDHESDILKLITTRHLSARLPDLIQAIRFSNEIKFKPKGEI